MSLTENKFSTNQVIRFSILAYWSIFWLLGAICGRKTIFWDDPGIILGHSRDCAGIILSLSKAVSRPFFGEQISGPKIDAG